MNIEYEIIHFDKPLYNELLNVLKKQCTSFNLVSPNTHYRKNLSEDVLSKSKKVLSSYCIFNKWVNKWPGTKSSKKVSLHAYKINDFCINYLKSLGSFFELEEQIDISFFNNETCLCYTVSHENVCFISRELLSELP